MYIDVNDLQKIKEKCASDIALEHLKFIYERQKALVQRRCYNAGLIIRKVPAYKYIKVLIDNWEGINY